MSFSRKTEEKKRKRWYIQANGVLFSPEEKRAAQPSHIMKHLTCMLQKKKSRSDKNTYCTASILYSSGKGKSLGSLGQTLALQGLAERGDK